MLLYSLIFSRICEAILGGMIGDGGFIIRLLLISMVFFIIGCELIEKL